ncbi:MAG TPA: hypothetical protein VGB85_22975 [Nannocystis sp.]|jgi:hypothetical protein
MRRGPLAWWLTLCLGVTVPPGAVGGCEATEPAVAPGDPWPSGLAKPKDAAEAASLRAAGVAWTDRQVRQLYLERVAEIGPHDAALRAQGQTAEARARAAFQARHDARVTARAMMQDSAAVEALRARDQEKYGTPDGPSFEYLVERAQQKGLAGDAVYESIVESAQRTDAATNRSLGL